MYVFQRRKCCDPIGNLAVFLSLLLMPLHTIRNGKFFISSHINIKRVLLPILGHYSGGRRVMVVQVGRLDKNLLESQECLAASKGTKGFRQEGARFRPISIDILIQIDIIKGVKILLIPQKQLVSPG